MRPLARLCPFTDRNDGFSLFFRILQHPQPFIYLDPVVQKLDNAIHVE